MTLPLVSLQNEVSGTSAEIPLLMTCHYTDLGSASKWFKENFNQSEALPTSE